MGVEGLSGSAKRPEEVGLGVVGTDGVGRVGLDEAAALSISPKVDVLRPVGLLTRWRSAS